MALKIAAFFTLLIGAGLMLLGLATIDKGIADSIFLWWAFFLQTGWVFGLCSVCGLILVLVATSVLVDKTNHIP